jgi:hypothetical protein
VSFHDLAHVIPESLGNKKLFSNYECDSCNHEFGNTIEDHLNKYLMPYRIGSIILGKKTTLSYKIGKNDRLDVTGRHWNITHVNGDEDEKKLNEVLDTIVEEIDDHTVRFKIKRQTYIPIFVYKALEKIALDIIPDNEVSEFNDTFIWLKANERRIEDFFPNL